MAFAAVSRKFLRPAANAALRDVRRFAAGSPDHVTATEARDGSEWKTLVTCGQHSLVSDLAREAAGNDAGPSPKELLMASLASCTAMTVRTFFQVGGSCSACIEQA